MTVYGTSMDSFSVFHLIILVLHAPTLKGHYVALEKKFNLITVIFTLLIR